MTTRPFMLRLLPASLRRGIKHALRPYARRLCEAYLDEYLREHNAKRMHPLLTQSATHIPVAQRGEHPSGLWGYMRLRCEPDTLRWTDGLPIPPKHLWHGYAERHERMMEIGHNNMRTVRRILGQAGGEPGPGDKILDFGCAGGFVLRHFLDIATDTEAGGEVWGVDFSGPHIDWCVRHLMPPFRFALTSSLPSLPFPDGYFDLAYCISVFSHMGENCEGWLLELARVIKPGGRLYLSVVTKESMHEYFTKRPALGFSKAMHRRFTPEQLASDFAVAVVGNGPGCHSVYDLESFKAKCRCAFEVVSVTPEAHSHQWAIVLRRPGRTAVGPVPEVVVRRAASEEGAESRP